MTPLHQLNPEQQSAVSSTQGALLILAGAGSGKTRVITFRIAYLIEQKKVPPSQIWAMTFTNKAAKEMEQRLQEMLGERKKGLHISTFHALCVQLLRKYIHHLGYGANFVIYDTQDQQSVLKGIIEEHGYEESGLIDVKSACYSIDQAKASQRTPEYFLQQKDSMKQVIFGRVYQEYQHLLKGCNAIDFNDILNLTVQLFAEHKEALQAQVENFRYLLVDEYQDTNRVQYQLLRYMTKQHQNLCVVGDDDQSIYGWRGADIQNILDFQKDFPKAKIVKLEQNYRSTQMIVNAANQVICQNSNRMSKQLRSQKGWGEPLGWIAAENETEEVQQVVDRMRIQVLTSKRKFADYAILYRSNFQSRLIEEYLREAGIAYTVVGSTSFYERKEIKDVLAYLRLIGNPLDEVSLHRVINYPKRGIGKTSFQQAHEICRREHTSLFQIFAQATRYPSISKDAARTMEYFVHLIRNYQQQTEKLPLHTLCEQLLEEVGLIREIETQKIDQKTKQKKLNCVYEFLHSLKVYQEANPNKGLREYLERMMLFSKEEVQPQGRNQVTLMTMHSAKGLEFPYVFMVGMADGVFPNQKSLDDGSLEEERRLCYVGITRAKEELTFSMPKMKKRYGETVEQSPSRFLTEIDSQFFSVPVQGKPSEAIQQRATEKSRSRFFNLVDQFRKETTN